MVERIFAGVVVDDLEAARAWYERLLGAPPDDAPMGGLYEWHFGTHCLQVVDVKTVRDVQQMPSWGHAGASSVTLVVSDLEPIVASAEAAGVKVISRFDNPTFRTTSLADPAGNLVTLLEQNSVAS